MSQTVSLSPGDLLVDVENPRLPLPSVGQREALRAIATNQGRKLQKLAADILQYGLNPAELTIVMPLGDDLNRHVVIEGNRRLAALRALENPEFLVDAVTKGVLSEIRRLSKHYQSAPIDSVTCVVVKDRQEARHWQELKHIPGIEGAGLIKWESDDISRFRARSGTAEFHTQALNFLETLGFLTPEKRRKVPASTFKRLLGTPEVRLKLGIELRDKRLHLLADASHVAKALLYVAEDLASGNTKVPALLTRPQRIQYANNLTHKDTTVTLTHKPGEGVPVAASGVTTKDKSAKGRTPKQRDRLIPRDCALNVNEVRLRDIERELRQLRGVSQV